MAVKFIDSLESFITILGPYGQSQLSDYCTGMVFGLEGVRVLKKVATRIRDKNVMERLRYDKAGEIWLKRLKEACFTP